MPSALLPVTRSLVIPALVVLLLAACASTDDRASRGNSRGPRSFPNVTGDEAFFDGRVIAEVRVGALGGAKPGERRDHDDRRTRRGRPPGGPGMAGPRFGGDGPGDATLGADGGPGMGRRPLDAGGAPPVLIHLKLTNRSTEPVDVVIADFTSPLGNFVIRPDKLSLAPGESREVEPMTSRIAEQMGGGDMKLRLKLGAAEETKVIPLAAEAPAIR